MEFCAFADDLKAYCRVDILDQSQALQATVNKVFSWSQEWGLPLSKDKCRVLHLCKKNNRYPYTIGGASLKVANSVLDLGFLITEDLSFDRHCAALANKASFAMHNLFRSLSTTNTAVFLRAYKVYIRPLLEYGTPVFNPHLIKSVKVVESVQNNFTRRLMVRQLGFSYDQIPNSADRNLNFGLQTLEYRRKCNDAILYHKVIHHMTSIKPSDVMVVRSGNTLTGRLRYDPGGAKLNCRRYFFACRAASLYAKLRKKAGSPLIWLLSKISFSVI